MTNKLMYCAMDIPNDDKQNYPFCKSQFVVEIFGHSTKWTYESNLIKFPRLLSIRIEKRHYKDFGDWRNEQPPLLCKTKQRYL